MIKQWKEMVGMVAWGSYIPKVFRGARDEDVNSFCLNVVAEIRRGFPKIDLQKLGAVYVGSESFPYAVKPVVSLVAEMVGSPEMAGANLEFACKAGTAALRMAALEVVAGASRYALAMGADISQAKPGDVLEKTVGAGAAGVVLGIKKKEIAARLLWMGSRASDTSDFWRRAGRMYPEHAGRFTGEPSYLTTVRAMTKQLLEASGMAPEEFGYVALHSPNLKLPDVIAREFGFRAGLVHRELFPQVQNAYAGSTMLSLVWAVERAQPGEKILAVSYGSGAGSDGFIFEKV